MASKRSRGKNFSEEDTLYLLNLAAKYKHIIENKLTNAVASQEKSATWKCIANLYNASHPLCIRSADKLSAKYENLKHQARKYAADNKQEIYKTGGGPSEATNNIILETVLNIINKITVEGEENSYDCDSTPELLFNGTCVLTGICGNEEIFIENTEVTEATSVTHTPMSSTQLTTHVPSPPTDTSIAPTHTATSSMHITPVPPIPSPHRKQTTHTFQKRKRNERNQVDIVLDAKEKFYNAKTRLLELECEQKAEDLINKKLQNRLLQQEIEEKIETKQIRLALLSEELEEKRLLNEEKRAALSNK